MNETATAGTPAKIPTRDETRQALRDRLNELTRDNLDLDASDYLTPSDLDDQDADAVFDKLSDAVNESCEIIYYSTAMEYLSENDASLSRSLAIASEMGYTLEDLNSEKLATLLNYEDTMSSLYGIRGEIEEIVDERGETLESEEE